MATPPSETIAVIGLGYVGLPLAAAFADHFRVIGFDINPARVEELRAGRDHTGEASAAELAKPGLSFTSRLEDLAEATFLVVAVPTPVNEFKDPDLTPLQKSSETVGRVLRPGMMVVYESTVYPGVTEEVCLPILERVSGLKLGQFDLGYSPERINPGDKEHTVRRIVKVVSGHDKAAADRCAAVYGAIIEAGVHRAADIKTAEAAKVIENVQRDLNIALMNELSKIFDRLGIHTQDVLAAAGTKWNFHKYHPGLVGGHCIGVDPYYLTKRAQELGYEPEVILSGRRVNDGMAAYVAEQLLWMIAEAGRLPRDSHVLVLGLTFKEDVPDCRNTKAADVVKTLRKRGARVSVWEPLLEDATLTEEFRHEYALEVVNEPLAGLRDLDGVVLVNGHRLFREAVTLTELRARMRTPCLFDVKNFFSRAEAGALGFHYKSL
jgi:UDP-N-acetyl-D-galactosamine dehydrogenase